jgi:nucleoside-diphosphate-sugar epimerase
MNLLITGIHGFVGSNLTKALTKDHTIYGLDIVTPEQEGVVKTFSWMDLDQLPETDAIVHLAGKAHDTKDQTEAQVYFDINTGLTRKIYNYFLASQAKKFIFFSSVKAAADAVHGNILSEEVIPNPKGPYGESKIQAEKYIQDHWPAPGFGKSVYILRPCMIHGPGNKGNLNLLYKVVQKGIPWPLGAFENQRSYTSIANLCFVIDRLISNPIAPGIYHMGDDEVFSTNELIELMCEALGRRVQIWYVPKGLMTGIARLGGMLHLPLNPERLRKLTEDYVVSNDKIKRALGIDRMPVSAREGLKRTLLSFKGNGG